MNVGIERLHAYVGRAAIGVPALGAHRGLEARRIAGLELEAKSVGFPCEDVVTNAVNAARPVIDALDAEERRSIAYLIVATESGIDFGKAAATYVHHHLGLDRRCRLFESKQACFAATAVLGLAAGWLASGAMPGARVLVIASDISGPEARGSYVEPTQGHGAVALLLGTGPACFELDLGATGAWSFEVMDTCRPLPLTERGDPDTSLLAYLECLERSFADYATRVDGADWMRTFDYLAFHTPFGGMVRGAHRSLLRRRPGCDAAAIERDFARRVGPSLEFCRRTGNLYGATVYLGLAGIFACGDFTTGRRVGIFSYGSGCSAEFFSGVVPAGDWRAVAAPIAHALGGRLELSIADYERVLAPPGIPLGAENAAIDPHPWRDLHERAFAGRGLLTLRGVRNHHREYDWS